MHVDVVDYVIDLNEVVAVGAEKPSKWLGDSKYTVYMRTMNIDVLESNFPRDQFIKDWTNPGKKNSKPKAKKTKVESDEK